MAAQLILRLLGTLIISNNILQLVNGQVGACDVGYYQCANRRCIQEYHVCDGLDDCLDNSDETSPTPCSTGTLEYFTDDYLVVADNLLSGLYQIQMSTGSVRRLRIPGNINPIAVSMDSVNKNVYYTDVPARTINRFSMIYQTTTVLYRDRTNAFILDGLELDIDRGLMYISDARLLYPGISSFGGNGSIVEMDINGNFRRTIVHDIGMLPRALALDKDNRMLYYSDWGLSGIYKISLSVTGARPTAIVSQGLVWPNALVADFQRKEMFWADASTSKIEMSNLDGTNRRVISQRINAHYFGMTMTSSDVYFTDWNSRFIGRFDRYTYQFQYYSSQSFTKLSGITYYQSGVVGSSTSTSTKVTTPTTITSTTSTKFTTPTTTLTKYNPTTATLKSTTNTNPITASTVTYSSSSRTTVESPVNTTSNTGPSSTTIIIVAVVVGGVVLIVGIVTCGLIFVFIRRKRERRAKSTPNINREYEIPTLDRSDGKTSLASNYTSLTNLEEDNPAFRPTSVDGYYEATKISDFPQVPPSQMRNLEENNPAFTPGNGYYEAAPVPDLLQLPTSQMRNIQPFPPKPPPKSHKNFQ